jgi:segregation and condensation protein A
VSRQAAPAPEATVNDTSAVTGFAVHLDNFDGPFDLLLQLIAKHQLDITEVSLSHVTEDFIRHLKALGGEAELEQTTQFLVVAATLLDLKIVRLLPSADLEDEEDLALLEARDLLFARLLQYRAFRQAAAMLAARMDEEARQVPRTVGLDDRLAGLLPEVSLDTGIDEFARIAARALEPREPTVIELAHLHAPQVSVREQGVVLIERLRRALTTTFRALTADSPDRLTTVARFLALLELYRDGAVAFDQMVPLGELSIRWTGDDDTSMAVEDEYEASPEDEQIPAESVTDDDMRRLAREPVPEGQP